MGQLLRRSAAGDEVVAEWSPADEASTAAAERAYRDYLARDYEAVQSDGVRFQPIRDDTFPVDAEQIVLTTGMGGG